MLRHLAKLAQQATQSGPSDQDGGSAVGEYLAANAAKGKSSSSATAPSALAQRDLRVSFNLLYQEIIRSSDPKLKAGQPHADARLLEDMRQKLIACESEKLKLKSDLEYAHQRAHAYWDRCKTLKAELDQLNAGAIVTPVSRARSTRGVL